MHVEDPAEGAAVMFTQEMMTVLVWSWMCRVGNRLGTSEAEQQDLEFIRTKGEKGPRHWPSFLLGV